MPVCSLQVVLYATTLRCALLPCALLSCALHPTFLCTTLLRTHTRLFCSSLSLRCRHMPAQGILPRGNVASYSLRLPRMDNSSRPYRLLLLLRTLDGSAQL
jgi:hypothetical protein